MLEQTMSAGHRPVGSFPRSASARCEQTVTSATPGRQRQSVDLNLKFEPGDVSHHRPGRVGQVDPRSAYLRLYALPTAS
jgi:hypothetical protein